MDPEPRNVVEGLMLRMCSFVVVAGLFPIVASAQQPCTTDARHVIDTIYRQVLERQADGASDALVARLQSGMTPREVIRAVAKSPEHKRRFLATGNEAANRQALTYLYRHLLGRDPDAGGWQTYGRFPNGVDAVIDAMVGSDEYVGSAGDYGVPGTQVRYCEPGQSSAVTPPASRFTLMDVNRDGIIARSEWTGTARAFTANDWNRDGVLSGDEIGAGTARRRREVVGTTGASVMTDRQFDALDRNLNGRLERNEWTGARDAFTRLDTNGNNILSRAEVVGTGNAVSDEFLNLDNNRDGGISIEEWNWNRRTFDRQDTNRDGSISPQEFTGAPVNQPVR
jgi:hypothetical protein